VKNRAKRVTALGLSMLLIAGTANSGAAPAAPALRYDGETLYRGLFYGSGPAAKLFPEIWESSGLKAIRQRIPVTAEAEAKKTAILNAIVARIRWADATFFDHLAVELQSGDHVRIQESLDLASRLTRDAIKSETDSIKQRDDLRQMASQDFAVLIATVVVALAVVVVDVVAIEGAVVVLLMVEFWEDGMRAESSSALKREVWVNLVAERLAPGR